MPRIPHNVTRRNRKQARVLQVQQAVTIVEDVGDVEFQVDPHSLNGNLTVIPIREFEFAVPHSFVPTDKCFDDPTPKVNQLGPVFECCVPLVTESSFDSFMAAFNKRCNFRAEDDIDDDVFREAIAHIDSLPDIFSNDPWDDNDDDRQRWLDKFGDEKRRKMVSAFETVDEHDARFLGAKTIFVKREALLKRDDPTWAPRIVYMGSEVYNAVTGPPAMIAMERFMRIAQQFEFEQRPDVQPMFAYKRKDVALACHINDPVYKHGLEGDFSRNDKEQRKRVHILFDRLLGKLNMPGWYRTLEKSMSKFKVTNTDFGLRAWLEWQLPTGTTITTVRNSFYNWVMFCVYMKRTGNKAVCLILGDDILAATLFRVDTEHWRQFVAKFKMVLKGKNVAFHGFATFLSRRFCMETETPCMFPLVGKALLRFNARGTENPSITDSQYMAGKALSYAYEFRHVPIMRDSFLTRYLMEDHENVQVQELSWFTRTSNLTLLDIVTAIRDEQVLLTQDEFELTILEVYDLDIGALRQMLHDVVECSTPLIYTHPYEHCLLVDV